MPRVIPGIAPTAAICLYFLLFYCGPQDTHEQIMGNTLGLMEQLGGFLEQTRDSEGVTQAADAITNLVPEFDKIAACSRAAGKPAEEAGQDLQKKFEKKRTQVLQRINTATEQSRAREEDPLPESP